MAILRPMPGWRRISAPTRSSISASTARWSGCPGRRWPCRSSAFPRRCWGPCLHVFGRSAEGGMLDGLLVAIARARRGGGAADESMLRALAADLALDADPLALDLADEWTGPRPAVLSGGEVWRTAGDTVER